MSIKGPGESQFEQTPVEGKRQRKEEGTLEAGEKRHKAEELSPEETDQARVEEVAKRSREAEQEAVSPRARKAVKLASSYERLLAEFEPLIAAGYPLKRWLDETLSRNPLMRDQILAQTERLLQGIPPEKYKFDLLLTLCRFLPDNSAMLPQLTAIIDKCDDVELKRHILHYVTKNKLQPFHLDRLAEDLPFLDCHHDLLATIAITELLQGENPALLDMLQKCPHKAFRQAAFERVPSVDNEHMKKSRESIKSAIEILIPVWQECVPDDRRLTSNFIVAKYIKLVECTPSANIREMLTCTVSFLRQVDDDCRKEYIIDVIVASDDKTRQSKLEKLQSELLFLGKIRDPKIRGAVVKYLIGMSSGDKKVNYEVIEQIVHCIEYLPGSGKFVYKFICQAAEWSVSEPNFADLLKTWRELTKKSLTFFPTAIERERFLKQLGKMAVKDQIESMSLALPLFSGRSEEFCTWILREITENTPTQEMRKEEADRLSCTMPLLLCFDFGDDWDELYSDLNEHTLPVIAALVRIQGLVTNLHSYDDIITASGRLGALRGDAEVVILRIEQLLNSITTRQARSGLLFNLFECYAYLPQMINLLQGIDDSPRRVELLRGFVNIPWNARARVFQMATDALQNIASADERYARLQQILGQFVVRRGHQEDDPGYAITVAREDLQRQPKSVLRHLVELFSRGPKSRLYIKFINEAGVDVGGLGRTFVAELVLGIKDAIKMQELPNGLSLPCSLELDNEEKQCLQDLGQLMMFCMNATLEYPIGMFFDRGLFAVLKLLPERFLNDEFAFDAAVQNEEDFLQLVNIYAEMNSLNEKEGANMERLKQYVQAFTDTTDYELLKDAYAFAGIEYDEALAYIRPDNLKEHLKTLQSEVRATITKDYLIPRLKPFLLPIIEIAKGMRAAPFVGTTWKEMQKLAPSVVSEEVQGRLTHALVIQQLQFDKAIGANTRQWVQNWVAQADMKKLALFVFALTGARALGSEKLLIKLSADKVYFGTCFNYANLPLGYAKSQEELNEVMDNAIAGIENEKFNRA